MDIANAAILQATPYVQDAWHWTNSTLDLFEKWQLVLFTSAVCYLIYCAWDFWDNELEKGIC